MNSSYKSKKQKAPDASNRPSHPSGEDGEKLETRESQIEKVLAAVRVNLSNASQTWGERSQQYQMVRQIEGQLLIEKSEAWGLDAGELADLLNRLNLSDK